jgi:hypothetical protein
VDAEDRHFVPAVLECARDLVPDDVVRARVFFLEIDEYDDAHAVGWGAQLASERTLA